jgi:hypothetical protein
MQAQRQSEERHVEREDIGGKPARQIDVGNRAASGSKVLRHSCQRTATAVSQKDDALTRDDSSCDRRSSVLAPLQPCVDQVPHAELDGKVDERMHGLHTNQRRPSPGWWQKSVPSTRRNYRRFGNGSLHEQLLAQRFYCQSYRYLLLVHRCTPPGNICEPVKLCSSLSQRPYPLSISSFYRIVIIVLLFYYCSTCSHLVCPSRNANIFLLWCVVYGRHEDITKVDFMLTAPSQVIRIVSKLN